MLYNLHWQEIAVQIARGGSGNERGNRTIKYMRLNLQG